MAGINVETYSLYMKALRCVRVKEESMRTVKAAGFSYRAATTLIPFCATRASPPPSYLLDASVDELRLHNSEDPVFHPPLPSFLPSFLPTLGFKVLCSVSFFILYFLRFFPL